MFAEVRNDRRNIEVVESRKDRGNYFVCVDDKDQRSYFWSFRRLRLVGFGEAFIDEEGLVTDRELVLDTARRLAGSPSGRLH